MVSTGTFKGLMSLSKPDLVSGCRNPVDKTNVGVHEFTHLVDKKDAVIDGVPQIGLDLEAVFPWPDLVRRKIAEIESGRSDINRDALTNEAEFFAVTSEYLFERSGLMQHKHPELYVPLERVFNHSLRTQVATLSRELLHARPKFGRNSPCRVAVDKSSRSAASTSGGHSLTARPFLSTSARQQVCHSVIAFMTGKLIHVTLEWLKI